MKRTAAVTLLACLLCAGAALAQDDDATTCLAVSKKAADVAVKRVAIFLTSNDPNLVRCFEDAIAIHFANAGVAVVGREVLERRVAEAKKAGSLAGDNPLDVGRLVGADVVVTGTVLIAASGGTAGVKTASLGLIAVDDGEALLRVLVESRKGHLFSEAAKQFVDLVGKHTKQP